MMSTSRVVKRLTMRRAAGAAVVGLAVMAVLVVLVPTGSAREQTVPANTVAPTVAGIASLGQTLTASPGTWTGTPDPTFTYQWVRCPASGGAADGSDCAVIGGASTTAYVIASGDVGSRLRVRVTGSNTDGSVTVASNATEVVGGQAGPPNTQPPTIVGSPVVGQTLTANPGTWTGSGITFAYAWSRCDATGGACTPIPLATQSTYTLVAADSGKTIRVTVTATNTTGSNSVQSAATAAVTTPSGTTGCPPGTGRIDVDRLAPPVRLQITRQRISPDPVTRETQTIRVSFQVTACTGRPVEGALVYATPTPYEQFGATEQPTGDDGWAILTMRRQSAFPASGQQQLLVVFARARKEGEDLLAGISTRRLVSFTVNLRG
jgi:hypothetical protein